MLPLYALLVSSCSLAAAAALADTVSPKPTATLARRDSPCRRRTRTVVDMVTVKATAPTGVALGAAVPSDASSTSSTTATAATAATVATAVAVPDTAVPVARGGSFNPSAFAEANQRDNTATRTFANVAIHAPNGKCLYVDPTAGDFRGNLIPVALVDCAGTQNEKWDVISAGAHNDVPGTALIVSTVTNNCISFDSRRAAGDTVTMFPCGGRADGSGETNADQLMPFIGQLSFAFAPTAESNKTCILASETDTRLTSGACPTDGAQLFSVIP